MSNSKFVGCASCPSGEVTHTEGGLWVCDLCGHVMDVPIGRRPSVEVGRSRVQKVVEDNEREPAHGTSLKAPKPASERRFRKFARTLK
jgi:hypothetical protein